MAQPYVGEIRQFAGNFAPAGWMFCEGQLLPISEYETLFNLIGTTYGGDGRVNFALPDLRSRVPIHMGSGHTLGERAGEQGHTLSISELPTHTHVANATSIAATASNPNNTRLLSNSIQAALYAPAGNLVAFDPRAISNVGGSQAHLNMQPFLVLNFSIALQGIFPSQT